MAFKRFQDFLSNLVSRQRRFFVGSEEETIEADKVLVSVGRKPYTEGLNLSKVGIKNWKSRFFSTQT